MEEENETTKNSAEELITIVKEQISIEKQRGIVRGMAFYNMETFEKKIIALEEQNPP